MTTTIAVLDGGADMSASRCSSPIIKERPASTSHSGKCSDYPNSTGNINNNNNKVCTSSANNNYNKEINEEDREQCSQVLLDLARVVCEEQNHLENLTHRIMKHAQNLLQCSKCQIFLILDNRKNGFGKVFEYEAKTMTTTSRMSPQIAGISDVPSYVSSTGTIVNIPDASQDQRFVHPVNGQSILAVPIRTADHKRVIGVFQLTGKLDGPYFTKNDEHIFEAFAIFCGIGIENTLMHERVAQAQARQKVALEILAYHAVAPTDQVVRLQSSSISSSEKFGLLDFSFSDFPLDDHETTQATMRMFLDLDLINKFSIDYEVLCRWILSVKKNYRDVAYHNWRHAFNVAQCMFASLKKGHMLGLINDLEAMCLLVACLSHDLDHRGTNNQFQFKTESPLSRLYSTSVMEHHHFDHCIMILNTTGNQIFSNLDASQYEKAIKILEDAILSTDLALYFQRRDAFFQLVASQDGEKITPVIQAPVWSEPTNKGMLFSMLMTACDISSITKPWPVQHKVAQLVANEFFQQGDLEKDLQITKQPVAMMDRSREHEIPVLQIQFIDSICLPLYKKLATFNDRLNPLLRGCLDNRDNWSREAEEVKRKRSESLTNN